MTAYTKEDYLNAQKEIAKNNPPREILPSGTYKMRITKIEAVKTQRGEDATKIFFMILDDKYKGHIHIEWMLSPTCSSAYGKLRGSMLNGMISEATGKWPQDSSSYIKCWLDEIVVGYIKKILPRDPEATPRNELVSLEHKSYSEAAIHAPEKQAPVEPLLDDDIPF